MNKDKHVLPDDRDTFTDRLGREASRQDKEDGMKVILGPDNEVLSKVRVKK